MQGTGNIHFGKWDNIDLEQEGAYGKASEQMTDYMYELAQTLLKSSDKDNNPATGTGTSTQHYVDLGSGTGGGAIRLLSQYKNLHASCINLCKEQNTKAEQDAQKLGLADRMHVTTGTYDETPFEKDKFDFAFSQDAFVHSFSKVKTYTEALRVVKPNGVFLFCDLMCGTGEDVSEEELQSFAQTNMVNDWLTPAENVKACKAAGFTNVNFVDLTADIRISFQLMGKKVDELIARGGDGIDPVLLATYKANLAKRVALCDRGVFSWGVIHARKP